MTEIHDLDSAEAAFSNAETALRELAGRSEQTTTVTERLSQTRAEIVKLRERFRQDVIDHTAAPEVERSDPGPSRSPDLDAATNALLDTASNLHERSAAEFTLLCDTADVLDQAHRDLGSAERTLADAHTAIREMILAHGDISRELKMASAALTALKPEGLTIRLDEINWGIGDTGAKLAQTVESLTTTQTEVLSAQLERLGEANATGKRARRQRIVLIAAALALGVGIGFGVAQLLG